MDEKSITDDAVLKWCDTYSSHAANNTEQDSRYEKLSTRRVDLVGDYAGNELFLLDGDSLILNCLNDSLLDFEGEHFERLWQ